MGVSEDLPRKNIDRWIACAGLLVVALTFIPLSPGVSEKAAVFVGIYVATLILLVFAGAAAVRTSRRLAPREGGSFWLWIAVSMAAWATGDLSLSLRAGGTAAATPWVLVDGLFLLYYLGWIMALDHRPQMLTDSRLNLKAFRLGRLGRAFFVVGLFVYFVVLPRSLDVEGYLTWVPSFRFYVALDVYLVLRLFRACRSAHTRRWRSSMVLLWGASLFVLITDFMDLAWFTERFSLTSPGPSDLLYYLPMFFVVAAARVVLPRTGVDEPIAGRRGVSERGVPLIVYSLAYPVIHLALDVAESVPEPLDKARGVLVICWLVLLGGLNQLQTVMLRRAAREQTERRRQAEEHIRFLSRHDVLTGLLNRRELDLQFAAALGRAQRSNVKTGVLFIDLDRFKEVNDTLGHEAGDAALRAAADRLRTAIRDVDSLFRYGGDEFVLILEHVESREDAETVKKRILQSFDKPIEFDDESVSLSVSIGIALSPDDGSNLTELLRVADRSMYSAKGHRANG